MLIDQFQISSVRIINTVLFHKLFLLSSISSHDIKKTEIVRIIWINMIRSKLPRQKFLRCLNMLHIYLRKLPEIILYKFIPLQGVCSRPVAESHKTLLFIADCLILYYPVTSHSQHSFKWRRITGSIHILPLVRISVILHFICKFHSCVFPFHTQDISQAP